MAPATVEPYRIAVPEEVLDDLRARLLRTRWPKSVTGRPWEYGTNPAFLRRLVDYWAHSYDWRAWEARLNRLEQHRVTLDGLRIHVFVARGDGPDPLPIVLTHGWPGSAVELVEMIDPLVHPERHGGRAEDAFTVVIPSLPGTGFSDAPPAHVTPQQLADLWTRLMPALGFERYMAHGGDWGAVISSWMGVDPPPGLVGVHLNTAVLGAPWSYAATARTPEEDAHAERTAARQQGETAYQLAHGHKPLSLAFAMTDSPAGMAGWIVEKFHDWTNKGDEGDPPFSLDHLITNLMFYWLGDFQAATWLYASLTDRSGFLLPDGETCSAPTGVCLFPDDIAVPPPQSLLRRAYNLVHDTRAPAGGHFPGLEHPQALAADIRAFRRRLRDLA
jgi:microsomal epoxide hydrolase